MGDRRHGRHRSTNGPLCGAQSDQGHSSQIRVCSWSQQCFTPMDGSPQYRASLESTCMCDRSTKKVIIAASPGCWVRRYAATGGCAACMATTPSEEAGDKESASFHVHSRNETTHVAGAVIVTRKLQRGTDRIHEIPGQNTQARRGYSVLSCRYHNGEARAHAPRPLPSYLCSTLRSAKEVEVMNQPRCHASKVKYAVRLPVLRNKVVFAAPGTRLATKQRGCSRIMSANKMSVCSTAMGHQQPNKPEPTALTFSSVLVLALVARVDDVL